MIQPVIREHVWTQTDESLFETLVDRDEVMINHAVVPVGGGFPAHPTDSTVNIQVLRGTLRITMENGQSMCHGPGKMIEIERQTLIKLENGGDESLELLVVKAPHPRTFT